ncbi:MAG: Rieske 2Fe-2S domain-containing protein [Caldilineaceae bacterium]|nr:Rieske 2Fe-2S domain-containing protein [Caldilineaceae bacterium]
MSHSSNEVLPAAWYPLCRAGDLETSRVLPVQIQGRRYAVWRSASGKVSALDATCCHVGADLSRGAVRGETLQCPLHHWCYGGDGLCVHIPGDRAIPARARQDALHCVEAYGLVFGFVGKTPDFDIPRFVDEVDPVWSRATVVDVAAPYTTLVANSFDGQHFAAVHDRELLEPPQITRANVHHIAIHYRANVIGQRINDRMMRALGIDRVGVTIHCWGGSVLQVYNERTANTILVALRPLDEQRSRVYILTALKTKARGVARLFQPLHLAVARWLAVAFLRPDMGVLEGVTMRPRVLLPGTDDCLLTWLRYWRSLPRAEQGDELRERTSPGAARSSFAPVAEPLSGERTA